MTTTITTTEQFADLAPGSVITVRNNANTWERTDEGWSKNGFTLSSEHFGQEIRKGNVSLGVRPEVGQWWCDDSGFTLHLLHNLTAEDALIEGRSGQWWCGRFNSSGEFSRLIRVAPESLVTMISDPPEWGARAARMVRGAFDHYQEAATLRNRNRELIAALAEREAGLRREADEYKEALSADLIGYLQVEELDHDSSLGRVMQKHGLRLPPESVEVKVSISGSAHVSLDSDTLMPLMPEGIDEVSDTTVYVSWTKELVSMREVEHGECACNLSRRDVRTLLTEAGIDGDSVSFDEFDMECANC